MNINKIKRFSFVKEDSDVYDFLLNNVHVEEREAEIIARIWHAFFERIVIIFQYKREYIIDGFVKFLEKTFGIKINVENDMGKLFSKDYLNLTK